MLVLVGRAKELKVIYILTGKIALHLNPVHAFIAYEPKCDSLLCFFIAVYYGVESSFFDLAPHVVQVS